jgi:predicted peptidase
LKHNQHLNHSTNYPTGVQTEDNARKSFHTKGQFWHLIETSHTYKEAEIWNLGRFTGKLIPFLKQANFIFKMGKCF